MPENKSTEQIAAIILAGGQGRRFNYQDKGLVQWQGKALIEHVIERIKPQAQQIIISCNRNIEHYQSLGYQVVTDQQIDYLGPLAGIQSALGKSSMPYTLICACDSPQIPRNLAEQLLRALSLQSADIAYPLCGDQHHFLPVLLKTELLPIINDYLIKGGRSLKGLFSTLNCITVNFENQMAFSNFNHPEDLL